MTTRIALQRTLREPMPFQGIEEGLDEAFSAFGLTIPVAVRAQAPRVGGGTAAYCGILMPGRSGMSIAAHGIIIDPGCRDPHSMLYHELAHASQCEREGGTGRWQAEYDRQLAEHGIDPADIGSPHFMAAYRAIPFEQEAYYVQAQCDRMPLALLRT